jgi:hypothetical protein
MSIATLEKPKNRRRNGVFLMPDPPPLLNGDHLTVPEFERRYGAMPEIKQAVWQVVDSQIPWFALISTGLQPGESDHEGSSAASAASSARGKAAKAAPHLPCPCNTALKRGANESRNRIET